MCDIWVSDIDNFIYTNTKDFSPHCVEDLCSYLYTDLFELQTVNNQSKLIYLDRNYNITKMSKNMEIKPNIHRENILNMKTAVCVLVPVHCGSTGRLGLYNN